MKTTEKKYLTLLILFMTLTACDNPQEQARFELAQMNVVYSPDTFVKGARAGDLEVVKLFLQTGMDPDIMNKMGETALLNTVRYGRRGVLELLLANAANVEVRDRATGGTPLIWASTIGFNDAIKLLLAHDADLEATESGQGLTALMVASNNGKTETIRLLLDRGAKINARDNYNRTALIWAAHYDRDDTVQILLENGADSTVKEQIKGQNAFLTAVVRGKTETVKVFLDRNTDLNARDEKGRSALMLATRGNWPDTVKLLLEGGADLNARDQANNTALSIAQAYRHKDIEQMLLETQDPARSDQ